MPFGGKCIVKRRVGPLGASRIVECGKPRPCPDHEPWAHDGKSTPATDKPEPAR